MCTGSALGRSYHSDYTNINRTIFNKDTTSIDSIFHKHVKVSYGAYYNLLMGRYFALDDYKGVKSTSDAGISLRNIYSENIPIVLLGDYKIPLLLFDY